MELGLNNYYQILYMRIIFKIIPMVNPDGVIIGNYRSSMAGCDLNRRYDEPDFRFHPTVWSIKNMCDDLLNGN
jgi:murein tripeptide amidase MpaA